MKIVKIEFLSGTGSLRITDANTDFFPVVLTLLNWWGKKKIIKAFPTPYCRDGYSNIPLYFIFVDELGKELPSELSKQINNWARNQELLGQTNPQGSLEDRLVDGFGFVKSDFLPKLIQLKLKDLLVTFYYKNGAVENVYLHIGRHIKIINPNNLEAFVKAYLDLFDKKD